MLLAPIEAFAALVDYCDDSLQTSCSCCEGSQGGWQRSCRVSTGQASPQAESLTAVVVPRSSDSLISPADHSPSAVVFGKTQSGFVSKEATVSTSASQRCALLCRQLR